jgi:hypothetical protein
MVIFNREGSQERWRSMTLRELMEAPQSLG